MKTPVIFKTLSVILLVLLFVGGLGYVSVSQLKRNARLIVDDTLPGLTYAGSANATLAQAYNNLLLFLTTDDAEERSVFAKAVTDISTETTQSLTNYSKSIFDAEDRRLFDQLISRREKYLKIRVDVMSSAAEGRQPDALRQFKIALKPAYEDYRTAGEALLNYNVQVGAARGREITTICNLTQILVAVVGILLFTIGFLFGLFR
jgi:methyl-accepting chemotaxis protein